MLYGKLNKTTIRFKERMPHHSRTAEYMAFFRALESARNRNLRLFTDPFASRFLKPSLRLAAAMARLPLLNSAISRFIDRRWPGARASGVARTRYIDEVLQDALRAGLSQVVILGAGFDSRAYRIPGLTNVHVVEVDHPSTSETKQKFMRRFLGEPPPHVSFVAIDFNRENLADAMRSAGLDLSRPIFFLWEGVTSYLTAAAVDATLSYIATAAVNSRVLFTYLHRDVLRPDGIFHGTDRTREILRKAGEPWTFGFDPQDLPHYLEARGMRLISDIGSTDYRARYMGGRGRHLVGYEFHRIALAVVTKHGASELPADSTPHSQDHRHAES